MSVDVSALQMLDEVEGTTELYPCAGGTCDAMTRSVATWIDEG